jgi:hypothetical protein
MSTHVLAACSGCGARRPVFRRTGFCLHCQSPYRPPHNQRWDAWSADETAQLISLYRAFRPLFRKTLTLAAGLAATLSKRGFRRTPLAVYAKLQRLRKEINRGT